LWHDYILHDFDRELAFLFNAYIICTQGYHFSGKYGNLELSGN